MTGCGEREGRGGRRGKKRGDGQTRAAAPSLGDSLSLLPSPTPHLIVELSLGPISEFFLTCKLGASGTQPPPALPCLRDEWALWGFPAQPLPPEGLTTSSALCRYRSSTELSVTSEASCIISPESLPQASEPHFSPSRAASSRSFTCWGPRKSPNS